MTGSVTRWVVIAATVLGGLLAGMAGDRAVVQLPAWQQLGVASWGAFTRQADLGRGLILYPAIGLGAMVCSILAATLLILDRRLSQGAQFPAGAAALLAVMAFAVTRWAIVPHVLPLRGTPRDPAALSAAFQSVRRWWGLKAALHIATFLANLWTLTLLGRS